MQAEVLVVGAGPTGLVLALWLKRQGVEVRIVDQADAPGQHSRALAVQARTLELYRQLDLTERALERGWKTPAVNLWVEGAPKARLPFGVVGEDLTPYSFLFILPQDEHERLLIERLGELGVTVERGLELTELEERGDRVLARLRAAAGGETTCEASFVCGCDGARSVARQAIDAGFPGGTYQHVFYVADVDAAGPPANGELHIDLDEADFLAIFPIAAEGRVRLVGAVRGEMAANPETLRFEDVSQRAIRNLKLEVKAVNWFSTYRVHHRVAERFRRGRVFLAGDAAHIHSPVGGQGMNTGIGDAINLAWKLAAVLKGAASDRLLDTYETERIAFARRLVATTDRAFTFVTAEGGVADFLRTRLAPLVIPASLASERVRAFAFRTVSQITLNYRGSWLSQGEAGRVRAGDRLPWTGAAGADNFAPLATIGWQVHVYGAAREPLGAWCAANGLPLHVFPSDHASGSAGLAEGAAYLVRPDGYVALAAPEASPSALEAYLAARDLRPAPPP